MDFDEYQQQAALTEQTSGENGLTIALLGLSGEVGTLLAEFKKRMRDGQAHEQFESMVAEELGDILWYVSTIASRMNLDLNELAMQNIAKLQERWPSASGTQLSLGLSRSLPDAAFPSMEQLPRTFQYRFDETVREGRPLVKIFDGEIEIGDPLRDNAYQDDAYRYHDVFHFAYAAILGWSPVLRNLLKPKRKRKSNPMIDEVEDGGRAQVIEEGISAFVFDYARKHGQLRDAKSVDYHLLKTIKSLTTGLEVSRCSYHDWEQAILQGYAVWRQLVQKRSGVVIGNLNARTLRFEPL